MPGCPIRKSTDQILFADPRSLSQLITSFFASESLGIPHTPLITSFNDLPLSRDSHSNITVEMWLSYVLARLYLYMKCKDTHYLLYFSLLLFLQYVNELLRSPYSIDVD